MNYQNYHRYCRITYSLLKKGATKKKIYQPRKLKKLEVKK